MWTSWCGSHLSAEHWDRRTSWSVDGVSPEALTLHRIAAQHHAANVRIFGSVTQKAATQRTAILTFSWVRRWTLPCSTLGRSGMNCRRSLHSGGGLSLIPQLAASVSVSYANLLGDDVKHAQLLQRFKHFHG